MRNISEKPQTIWEARPAGGDTHTWVQAELIPIGYDRRLLVVRALVAMPPWVAHETCTQGPTWLVASSS